MGKYQEEYEIRYKVSDVEYHLGTASSIPMIALKLQGLNFSPSNGSYISTGLSHLGDRDNYISLCLNRLTFEHLTGIDWDCTPQRVEEIKKDLEGKVFSLDFNMKEKSRENANST
ncbi:MAG TPA: hypothetical protein VJJ23_02935 [Candidatus Nanoarchaeia archaeon]|nr:hypothetical protein [Candidatus Nanoarchaeia archaeon]